MHSGHSHHAEHSDDAPTAARQRWLAAAWSFIATALPAAPARVLEIGCGPAGGIVPAALRAGYPAVGVDPDAPDGPDYRRVPFEAYQPPSALDAVVSCQAIHHLPDLDAAFEQVDRMLAADGVLVIVEWAWERIDETTARWCFDQVGSDTASGWAHQQRADWAASGQPWHQYLAAWGHSHGLHAWADVAAALAARFDMLLCTDAPALFGDVPEISESAELSAIAAGQIAATGVQYIGRRRGP